MSIRRFATLLLRYGLVAVGLAATTGLSALLTMRSVLRSQEVVVPSVQGRAVGEAGTIAARRQLQVKVEGRRHDARVAVGHVAAQEPPPGATLKTGRSIRVWLSLGPRRVSVPRLEGESLRAARVKLEQVRLPLLRVAEVPDLAPAGTVLLQQPPAGETEGAEGASLLVSRGPSARDYVMPDLIGRPAAEVVELFERAGIRVAHVRQRTYPGVAPGIVLRQDPPAGHRVRPDVAIALDVSQAPEATP